jgi:hypothetical protein
MLDCYAIRVDVVVSRGLAAKQLMRGGIAGKYVAVCGQDRTTDWSAGKQRRKESDGIV